MILFPYFFFREACGASGGGLEIPGAFQDAPRNVRTTGVVYHPRLASGAVATGVRRLASRLTHPKAKKKEGTCKISQIGATYYRFL